MIPFEQDQRRSLSDSRPARRAGTRHRTDIELPVQRRDQPPQFHRRPGRIAVTDSLGNDIKTGRRLKIEIDGPPPRADDGSPDKSSITDSRRPPGFGSERNGPGVRRSDVTVRRPPKARFRTKSTEKSFRRPKWPAA